MPVFGPLVPEGWTGSLRADILGTQGGMTVKVTVVVDPQLNTPEVVIRAPAVTPEVERVANGLRGRGEGPAVTAFREGEALLLPRSDILRFFADGKGVSCQTAEGVCSVRQRLYELEEQLAGTRFVRVSHSEIINLDKVTALDLSLSGTIRVTLAGGVTAYASRRYVKKLKQAAGTVR